MGQRINVEKAIRKFREVEVLQSQDASISEACRKLGIKEHTYYRWKKKYGRLDVDQSRRLGRTAPSGTGHRHPRYGHGRQRR